MLSPFIDSSVNNVLLKTSTSHFLSSSTFLQRPIDSLLHDTTNTVRTEIKAVGAHRSGEIKFIDFFVYSTA